MATLAEQLTSVQAAISDIETNGQTMTEEGQVFGHADLRTLYAREDRLLRKIERASSGRIKVAEI